MFYLLPGGWWVWSLTFVTSPLQGGLDGFQGVCSCDSMRGIAPGTVDVSIPAKYRMHQLITYIFGYNRRYSVEKIENSTAVTGFHTNVGAPREAAMTALTTMNIPAAQRAFEVLPKWLELDFVKQRVDYFY